MVILCYTNCCSHWGEAKMNRVLSWQCLGSDGDPPMTIIFVRDETAQNQFDLDSTQDAIGVPFESLQISGFVEDPKNPGLVQGMFILRFHTRGDSKDQSCLHSMITWFGDFDADTPWRILGFQSGLGPPERGSCQGLQPGHWRSCEKFLDVASRMFSQTSAC